MKSLSQLRGDFFELLNCNNIRKMLGMLWHPSIYPSNGPLFFLSSFFFFFFNKVSIICAM